MDQENTPKAIEVEDGTAKISADVLKEQIEGRLNEAKDQFNQLTDKVKKDQWKAIAIVSTGTTAGLVLGIYGYKRYIARQAEKLLVTIASEGVAYVGKGTKKLRVTMVDTNHLASRA